MKLNTIIFLIKEGCKNLWTSKKTAISSLIIILATMLMLGIFVLITVNIENTVGRAIDSQGLQAFLQDFDKEEVTEKTEEIKNQILDIYSVKSVEYISKEEGLKLLQESVGEEYIDLLNWSEEENPIPASFIIKVDNIDQMANVKDRVLKITGVTKASINEDTAEALSYIGKAINIVGIVVLLILLAISVFIISNTIKITMYARRKEISIMKYVGATDGFIRLPFMIEGMLIGLVDALVSTGIVALAYSNIWNGCQDVLLPFSQVSQELIVIYIILGVGIGIVGSTMSIKKYLDV